MCVQSVVPASQPQQEDVVSSVQLVVAVSFVCLCPVCSRVHEELDDDSFILVCHPCVLMLLIVNEYS